MYGMPDAVENFYGEPLIKVELWDPADRGNYIKCLFPRKGFAGSWFAQNPQTPETYTHHRDPMEYYKFLIPQMLLRHIASGERLIADFTDFHIGLALGVMLNRYHCPF